MRHLIIGAGNMGKRHGKILEGFGDRVEYQDIGFRPGTFDFCDGYDSALICTPPETHVRLIEELWAVSNMPVFCEKPLFGDAERPCFYNELSMVACNWRFCPHFQPSGNLTLGYPTTPASAKQDLIHFVDAWWNLLGRPESAFCINGEHEVRLILLGFGNTLDVRLDFTRNKPTIFNDKRLHKNSNNCKMFQWQMEHWRNCLRRGEQSCNPIEKAVERTEWLHGLISRGDLAAQA